MPWLKAGDNAATHPVVVRAGVGGDARTANEVFGFVLRCALHSAAHVTDYFVDDGIAALFGGADADRLVAAARKAGYWRRHRRDGHRGWLLLDDPDFLHIRLKEEIDWEKQQKNDAADPTLFVPVRLRDGDACRYCGSVVYWRARKGNRRGSYDHREPGKPATVDTMVVACGACNSGRRDDPNADDRYPLRPVPALPYYSQASTDLLARHGHRVQCSEARPGNQPENVPPPSDPAPSGTTPCDPAPSGTTQPPTARTAPLTAGEHARTGSTFADLLQIPRVRSADSADPPPARRVGTGRPPGQVGSAAAQGRVGSAVAGRRGRRGRPRGRGG